VVAASAVVVVASVVLAVAAVLAAVVAARAGKEGRDRRMTKQAGSRTR
jgi:hypothetical protein